MNLKNCTSPFFFAPVCELTAISESYGRLYGYNKVYDRITTKTERPLQPVDRIKYNTTTSDDPIIQQVQVTDLS
jgi:Eukaryotic translation initiation factor 3 subunit 7 (eIF-3)